MDYFYQYEDTVNNYYRFRIYDDMEYRLHMHEYFEIVYVIAGDSILSTESGDVPLEKGSLALIMDNQLHGYRVGKERCRIFLARFSRDLVESFADFTAEKQPEVPVIKCSDLACELIRRCLSDDESNEEAILRRRAALTFIASEFLSKVKFIERKTVMTDPSRALILYIIQNFKEDVTLEQAAKELGYSPCYLSGCFHRSFGLNFRQVLNYHRIEYAKLLLESGVSSVIDAGLRSGFKNHRSFERAFIENTGMSPAKWRSERTSRH